jgi:hypothetical protein
MKEKNKEKEALAKKVAAKLEAPSLHKQIMDEKRVRISHPFYISFSLSYRSFKDMPFYNCSMCVIKYWYYHFLGFLLF